MTQFFPTANDPRAICVLTHGLNTNPDRFDDLRKSLLQAGFSVVMVSLTGHQKNYKAFEKATADRWLNDLKEGFQCACAENKNQVPIHSIGYSLGGLLNMVYLTKSADIKPSKLVYIAPGNATHRYIDALKWISFVAPGNFSIRSRSINGYAVHDRLPMQAYRALFRLQRRLQQSPEKQLLNQDSLVLIDPKDELVSVERLHQFRAKNQLDKWLIEPFVVPTEEKRNHYHHLLFDKPAMGQKQWITYTDRIIGHLLHDKISMDQ